MEMILEHCLSTRCRTHESQLLCRRLLEKTYYIMIYIYISWLWKQLNSGSCGSKSAITFQLHPRKPLRSRSLEGAGRAFGEATGRRPTSQGFLNRLAICRAAGKTSCHWQMVNCHQPVLRQMGCGAFFVKSPGSLEPFCQCFH